MPVPTNVDKVDDTAGRSITATFPPLDHFRVKNIPPTAFYVPDFITKEEEGFLFESIKDSPKPKWKTVGTGRRLQYWGGSMTKNGVLVPEPMPDFLAGYPDIIDRIESFLATASVSEGQHEDGEGRTLDCNQVLVNEYQADQGISPHEDGAAFKPLVCTLSLGSHTVLDIHHYLSPSTPSPPMTAVEGRSIAAVPLAHLLLQPRSLLVLSSSLYASHLHGIDARATDDIKDIEGGVANADLVGDAAVKDALADGTWQAQRGERISLTFRHAQKVVKGGAFSMALGALRRT